MPKEKYDSGAEEVARLTGMNEKEVQRILAKIQDSDDAPECDNLDEACTVFKKSKKGSPEHLYTLSVWLKFSMKHVVKAKNFDESRRAYSFAPPESSARRKGFKKMLGLAKKSGQINWLASQKKDPRYKEFEERIKEKQKKLNKEKKK